jgi:hypothetical protein
LIGTGANDSEAAHDVLVRSHWIEFAQSDPTVVCFGRMDAVASEGVCPMLRKTMIVLATAAALTGGLTADALARGGGGGHGGGFGGAHMGGGFGGARMGGFGGVHMGGGFGRGHFGGGFAGHHFAGARGHFDHDRGRRLRFGPGFYDYGSSYYDYGCSYGYPYYNRYSCYTPGYY